MNALNREVSLLEILETSAQAFWQLSSGVCQLIVRLGGQASDSDLTTMVHATLSELYIHAERLELYSAIKQLNRINAIMEEGKGVAVPLMRQMVTELYNRILDDLDMRFFITISPSYIQYYRKTQLLFDKAVMDKFSIEFEVDEAGKCHALRRDTACVFHLMRIMELGIEGARQCLGIADPIKESERNWGAVLRKFKEELDARNKNSPSRWISQTDRDFFAEIYASLDAVRNVWRNATMHVDKKYTAEEAEHIFSAVRGFMKKLASRCDEAGNPKA